MQGQTIDIDATTLEANAALRSIVRRDTGDAYQEFLTQLAQASGIDTPIERISRASIARGQRKARTTTGRTRMTRTHSAHKAENAVDLETSAIVKATVTPADGHGERDAALVMIEGIPGQQRITVAADKGYDTRDFVAELRAMHVTPHIAQHTTGRRSAIDARTTRHPGR